MAVVEVSTGREFSRSVQSFEDKRKRGKSERQSQKLTESEIDDLQYAWGGVAGELGCKSIQGAIQAKLMRSPPSNRARGYVLEELERAGGRGPEGAILRILTLDYQQPKYEDLGLAAISKYEFVRAIRYLVLHGKLERVHVEMPKNDEAKEMTRGQREWTGYDLRIVRRDRGELTMRLALASVPHTRADRWRAQDEALERMWLSIPAKDKGGGRKGYESEDPPNTTRATAVLAAIEKISTESVLVLRAAYGGDGLRQDLPGLEPYPQDVRSIVAMTPSLRAELQRLAEEAASKRKSVSHTREQLLAFAHRELRPLDVLRDRCRDVQFIGKVTTEANDMLVRACAEYRKARGPREQNA